MDLSPKSRLMQDWLTTEWAEKLCLILESMADERPSVERKVGGSETGPPFDAEIWQQKFAISPEPLFWVAAPSSTCLDLGRRTLAAAGVDSMEDEDAQNTFLELLAQSLSALGQSIGAHLSCEASATDGAPIQAMPNGLEWMPVRFDFLKGEQEPFWLAAAPDLLETLAAGPKTAKEQPTSASSPGRSAQEPEHQGAQINGTSKTFELLLDVALPVSISFGRTFLPLKEILKLTTGSIVELDRGVNEPVDVIVNNCVIARGEVVVVEGNYGVRIQQIASRYDRLRTGSTTIQAQEMLTGR